MERFMFNYRIRNIEPSQEGIGTIIGVAFLVWLGYMGVSGLIITIKEKFKSLEQKLEDKIRYLIDDGFGDLGDDQDVINGNDYPRADWTDAKDGKHWEIDQKLRKEVMENEREFSDECDPLIFYNCTKFDSYINLLKGYESLISLLNSAQIDPNLSKKVSDAFTSLSKLGVKIDGDNLKSIDLPTENITWPNHAVFKNPKQCANQLTIFSKSISSRLQQLVKKIHTAINDKTDGKSKEELGSRVVFLKSCSVAMDILEEIVDLFSMSQFTLNNDETFGSCLVLKSKDGKDITDHH